MIPPVGLLLVMVLVIAFASWRSIDSEKRELLGYAIGVLVYSTACGAIFEFSNEYSIAPLNAVGLVTVAVGLCLMLHDLAVLYTGLRSGDTLHRLILSKQYIRNVFFLEGLLFSVVSLPGAYIKRACIEHWR